MVEEQPAESPKLRSRTRLRAAAVRHFVDPSLAVVALGIAPDRLLAGTDHGKPSALAVIVRNGASAEGCFLSEIPLMFSDLQNLVQQVPVGQ